MITRLKKRLSANLQLYTKAYIHNVPGLEHQFNEVHATVRREYDTLYWPTPTVNKSRYIYPMPSVKQGIKKVLIVSVSDMKPASNRTSTSNTRNGCFKHSATEVARLKIKISSLKYVYNKMLSYRIFSPHNGRFSIDVFSNASPPHPSKSMTSTLMFYRCSWCLVGCY